jgi:hypothetical protein
MDEQRSTNIGLFSTYEPLRLWLNEREIPAPFRKYVVRLSDKGSHGQWHGHVSNAVGICGVTEAVSMTLLFEKARDHRWVLGVVQHSLKCVARGIGWRSEELDGFITSASEHPWPLVHLFEGMA